MAGVGKIEVDGKVYEAPIIEGTEGEKAIDISKFRDKTGVVTLDIGYVNTGSCTSAITFLDGEKGILKYRGYSIEDLAEKSNFLEVAYLLIYGKLPTGPELHAYHEKIHSYAYIPQGINEMLDCFPKDAHPMGVLSGTTAALSAFYPQLCDTDLNAEKRDKVIAQLMARLKVLSSYFFRKSRGLSVVESDPNLGYCADFLNMMFQEKGKEIDPEVARALDVLLILHADHEQNCSTSTVRTVGSAQANIFATIASGVNALWGPLHGGANQEVLEMLEGIQKAGGDYKKSLARAKDKNDNFRLMGFGHRVYKNFDPRAKIIKKACDTVLKKLNIQDPLLDIARGLEEEALRDSYFVERKLYPNVDFYSGIIYKALGIPTNMFTVMFALGRLPGWIAQWKEMLETPGGKITRPRQIYTGKVKEIYVPIEKRS